MKLSFKPSHRILIAAASLALGACSIAPSGEPAGDDPLTLAYQAALEPMRSQDWAGAERLLLQFAQKHPKYSGPWANLAIVYRELGRPDAAREAIAKALELNPLNAAAMNQRGILDREAGDFAAAEASYRAANKADPEYALAWLNLGILYDLYLQRPRQALAFYLRYEELMGGEVDRQAAGWIADLKRRTAR